MQLDLKSEDDVLLVTTNGRITCDHASPGVDPLVNAAGEHVFMCKVLIDLSNSEYVDSSGISWLLSCHKRAREAKGLLVLHSIPPLVLQTLKVLQLDRVLHLAKSLPAARALASQGAPAATPAEKPAVGELAWTSAPSTLPEEPIDFQPDDLSALPAEQAIGAIVDYASQLAASDLYLATDEDSVEIAVRHLGVVRTVGRVEAAVGRRWMSSIKALAGIAIDGKRRPNEGRWLRVHRDGRKTDLRINTIPTLYGEDFTLRLLERDSQLRSLDGLGLLPPQLAELRAMLAAPGGLILVTGPTSSGKTTTLYAALQHLNDGTRRINTIEDPIEYAVPGLRQSQVSSARGLDFPDLLRHVLRQAPDVIMIGEIRDPVTAQTAVRAAGSGHLVLATLHAPTAATAVQSMLNLEVHPRFFADSLRGVVAQRLVRTLCEQCKTTFDLSESPGTFQEVERWLKPGQGQQFFSSRGCVHCSQTGFTRRSGAFEVMTITPAVRKLMAEVPPARQLEALAIAESMIEFRRAGLLKVAQGLTSIEEVMRVVPAEHLGLE